MNKTKQNMTTHTHTKGPWRVGQHGETLGVYDMNEQWKIATIEEWNGELSEESEANARLIAAAPELLEVARWVAESLPEIIRTHCPLGVPLSVSLAHDMAREAVSKAKGGEA